MSANNTVALMTSENYVETWVSACDAPARVDFYRLR